MHTYGGAYTADVQLYVRNIYNKTSWTPRRTSFTAYETVPELLLNPQQPECQIKNNLHLRPQPKSSNPLNPKPL